MNTTLAIAAAQRYVDAARIYSALDEEYVWHSIRDAASGTLRHPVCSLERLAEKNDDVAIADSIATHRAQRGPLICMVRYARRAAEHARDLSDCLCGAISAYYHELWAECIDDLRGAACMERTFHGSRGRSDATDGVLRSLACLVSDYDDRRAMRMYHDGDWCGILGLGIEPDESGVLPGYAVTVEGYHESYYSSALSSAEAVALRILEAPGGLGMDCACRVRRLVLAR